MKKYIILPLLMISSCLFAGKKPIRATELANNTPYQATLFGSPDFSFQLSPFSTVEIQECYEQEWGDEESDGMQNQYTDDTQSPFITVYATVHTPSGDEIACDKIQKDSFTSYSDSWTLTVSSDNANTCRLTISKK